MPKMREGVRPVEPARYKHLVLVIVLFICGFTAQNISATVYNVNVTTDGHAINQLRGAIEAADTAGGGPHTINVAAGTYTLTLGEITFGNKPENISIIGTSGAAMTIISMTTGAGKDRIFFINPTGTVNSPVISVTGLTFQNGSLTSDPYGGAGICAGGGSGESLTISNCVFLNNSIPANSYGGAAVCMQVRGNLSIDNSTFMNNVSNDADGGAVLHIVFGSQVGTGFGDLSVTNSTFTNNSVVFPGAPTSNGGALAFSGQGGVSSFTVNVTGNTFTNNSADGLGGAISANNSANLVTSQVHYNRFVGNTSGVSALSSGLHFVESSGSVNAENNWWGCNSNPVSALSTVPCDQAGGDVAGGGSLDADPWLVLRHTASQQKIKINQSATLTGDLSQNSDGVSIGLANLARIIGLSITFDNPILGSIPQAQPETLNANAQATATFNAGGTSGLGTARAKVDNAPVQANSSIISSATESGTTATITTVGAHGYSVGEFVSISGVGVAGYNGNFFKILTTPTVKTFTYTAGSSGLGASSGGTSNAGILILQPPTMTKSFSPTVVKTNTPSTLTFSITNGNVVPIDGSFVDTLPLNLVVAPAPTIVNNCGGTVTAAAGATHIDFANAATPTGTCTIKVNVQSASDGVYNNSVTLQSSDAGSAVSASTATLTVINPPTITKVYGATSIALSGTTSLTFTINNPNTNVASMLNGIGFTDTLPTATGKLIVANPNGLSNTCSTTPTAVASSGSISLSGASLAAGASCTIVVNVQGTVAGPTSNNVTVSDTVAGTGNTSNALLTVVAPPTIGKSFAPSTVVTGQTSQLSITVTNPAVNTGALGALSGISFTDNLPASITAPNSSTTSCNGGTLAVNANVVTLTGGSLNAGANCINTVTVTATAASASAYTNTINSVTSSNGGMNNTPATANITVNKANTSTTVTSAQNPSVTGQPVTFTATINVTGVGAGTPTGSVDFLDGASLICDDVPISASIQCVTSTLPAGTRTITAQYNGDGNFNVGTSTLAGGQVVSNTATWDGSTSSDWNDPTNWTTNFSPGVTNPAQNDVVIPNVGAQPNIGTTDITILGLSMSNGRTLTITSPRILTIGGNPGGNLTLDGIITGGELRFGTGAHTITNAGGTGSISSTNVTTVLSGSTVTLNNNLQAGALAVNAGGSMTIANRTLSLNGSGAALAIAGGSTFTTTGSTVVYNGTAAQQAAGIPYNNLTINNTIGTNVTGVTLTGNATVNGQLALTSSDLDTDAFVLTQPNATASTGVSDVIGTVRRTGAPLQAAALTYGNPLNTIAFTAGTRPTQIDVTLTKASPATFVAAVKRTYDITNTGGSGFTATLQLHYLDSELNGNSEPALDLRRGPSWAAVTPTTRDNAANWVSSNAVTGFSQWTIASVSSIVSAAIHDVQGNGASTPFAGQTVVSSGIVIGNFQAANKLQGIFVQSPDASADADPNTSEGIFVACGACATAVNVGDSITATGVVSEVNGMTTLTATAAGSIVVNSTGNPLPTPAQIALPAPAGLIDNYYEKWEAMRVTFTSTLTVSGMSELGRFGHVELFSGGRPQAFTEGSAPNAVGYAAYLDDLDHRRVILDDENNTQEWYLANANGSQSVFYPGANGGFSVGTQGVDFFRGGDLVAGLVGILDFASPGSGAATWRIRPDLASPATFTVANPRPATAPFVGGAIKAASMSLQNYFTTIDTTASNSSGPCGPSATLDCRGADSATELIRQRERESIVACGLNADVVALMELENTTPSATITDLLGAINVRCGGAHPYAFVNTGGTLGTDAVRVQQIYRTGVLSPVGAPLSDLDPIHNLPPTSQTFDVVDPSNPVFGERFTVVANNLKARTCDAGATGGNADAGDGQGCYNALRTSQATRLLTWVSGTVLPAAGDPDVLLLGDFNSYAKETPTTTLVAGGYVDKGAGLYTYIVGGQTGQLDHAFASTSLNAKVVGIGAWHINADESDLFDYNDEIADTGEASFEEKPDGSALIPPRVVFQPGTPYRAGDHDPIIVGMFFKTTASEVNVSGRVLTSDGRGITNATVTVSGGSLVQPITAVTRRSGSYTISGLEAGETYIVSVGAKRFTFPIPLRVMEPRDNAVGVDFVADP